MSEHWRSVKGYESYEVSNRGRVRVRATRRLLTPCVTSNGYRKYTLSGKQLAISRLVLRNFDRDPMPGEVARHRDHDKSNNVWGNLVWGSYLDNARDSVIDQRQYAKIPRSQWSTIARKASKLEGSQRSICTAIAAQYSVDRTTIKRILRMVSHG